MSISDLELTANMLVAEGKGILAADETPDANAHALGRKYTADTEGELAA